MLPHANKVDIIWRRSPETYAVEMSNGKWLPYPWVVYVLRKIRRAVAKGNARIIFNAPPRHGKSEAVSHWLPTWYIDNFPENRVIFASHGDDLASDYGMKVREHFMNDSRVWARLRAEKRRIDHWFTTAGGGMRSMGIGGSISGRGGNLILIDDPHKDWAEAMSPASRRGIINWFNGTLYSRLEPNGSIICLQCMTGDTRVLMADGCEKFLRDIVPGDEVATYNAGHLEVSRVNNHINNGPDLVLTIRMISGITVKANERHPFLISRDGRPEWVRLKYLKPGDKIVGFVGERGKASSAKLKVVTGLLNARGCVPCIVPNNVTKKMKITECGCILRDIMASGKVSLVKPRVVRNLLGLRGFVTTIMARHSGRQGIDPQVVTQDPTEMDISNTDMGSLSSNMRLWLKSRMVCVPFVENFRIQKTQGPIAQENSVSITFTEPSRSADCCATTATSLLDTGKQKKHFSPQLATYEITLETIAEITESGYEDVFDIEVDRTGNFIANGLVSHNTRWHQEDLSGYLMNEHPDNWEVIKFPAIAEGSDVLGRIEGEALCPQRFTAEALLNIKCAMGSQMFAGLYQQRPAPMEGNLVKRIWFQRYSERPHRFDSVIQSWDMSFKETIAGSFVVGQVWGKIGANFYLLDQIRGRFSFVETQRHMISLCKRWPEAVDKLVEDAANGPAIISSLKDTVAGIIPVKATGSKAARLASVTGLIEAGNVFIPTVDLVEDADDLIEEICTFPYAAHDDQVDALSQSLSRLYGGGNSFNLSIPSVGVRSSPWNMSIS